MKSPSARPSLGLLAVGIAVGWCAGPDAQPLRAQDAHERPAVAVDPKVLDTYLGQYQLTPKLTLTLRRFRDRLTAQLTGQPPFAVYAESATTFRWRIVEARFTIEQDAGGRVTGVLFRQGPIKLSGKKTANAPPPDEDLPEPAAAVDSPRLAALAKDLKGGNAAALARFWAEAQDKMPLVEPLTGDRQKSRVTFVWRGDGKTRRVTVSGGPPLPTGEDDKPLERLADTDLWYRTDRVPNDARFVYSFAVNPPGQQPDGLPGLIRRMSQFQYAPKPDPLNPRHVCLQWASLASLLEMPGAPPQPWRERRPGVPRGTLSEHTIPSAALKRDQAVTTYTPPGYDPKAEPCAVLILFDGPFYRDGEMIPGPVILDNLIARKAVRPLVAVFVNHRPANRNKDLSCSEPFADFVAQELVPWVRANYRVSAEPRQAVIGGLSLGGLMASFCGWRHPQLFGNVLSQSGSYQWSPGLMEAVGPSDIEPGWLTRRFVASPPRPVRFYLEAGRYEDGFPTSLLAENRRFRDVLEAKGYSVRYAEFNGGHDYVSWRGSFADGLMALVGAGEKR